MRAPTPVEWLVTTSEGVLRIVAEHDEIIGHGIEWVDDTIGRWLQQNATAQQIQDALPAYVHERLSLLPEGHDALPMAMAMSMQPEAIREAREWLLSARAQIRQVISSLSHPTRIMGAGPSDEKTGHEVAEREEYERRIAELEAERDGLTQALTMIRAGIDAALSPPEPRRTYLSAVVEPGQ